MTQDNCACIFLHYIILTKEPTWILLTLCYPPTPTSGWGVDEHTDLGFLTILNQDQIGGLEVKTGSPYLDIFIINMYFQRFNIY